MSTKTRMFKLLALLMAVLMLTLSAGFAWAAADDYANRGLVPDGVTLGDESLSGLTADQVREVIDSEVSDPLMQPVTVTFQDKEFTLDPQGSLSIDVEAMLDQAYDPLTGTTLAERAYRKITGQPLTVEVEPVLSVEGEPLSAWVEEVASQVDTPSVDATMTLVNGAVVVQSSSVGYKTKVEEAVTELTEALLEGKKEVELPVEVIEPEHTEETMGKTIVVDLSERRLYLYEGTDVIKTYGVAIGTSRHPTPKGEWKIVRKQYMPSWSNPGTSWAASMPAYIPPGPSNPLGTRALYLNASGIRIHGTTNNWSIGHAASHGCLRMHRWDVEELYDLVPVGTKVFIVR